MNNIMKSIGDFYEWLNGFINFEKKPHSKAFCLDVIRYYAALFENPQTAYKTVHIAGSKGKGSVATMFAAMLTAAGKRTGLYTSPHVNDFRERITQNGAFFSDAVYIEAFRTVQQQVQPYIGQERFPQPSWFELVTLTAFVLFQQERLDWAVFETGMGGRLDATNIVEPAVVLLTPIELEHCEYLGTTIEEIAGEKAGIIKEEVPVFCSQQKAEALALFKKRAAELNAPFFYLPDCIISLDHRLTVQGQEVTICFAPENPVGKLFTRPIHTVLPLFTTVQAENAALAAAAFRYCCPEVSEGIIEQALTQAWLPARFQLLCTHPLIIIDGAHTNNSIQACVDTFFQLLDAHSLHSVQDSAVACSTSFASSGHVAASSAVLFTADSLHSIDPVSTDRLKPLLVFACAADKNPDIFAPIFLGKFLDIYITIPGTFKKGNLEQTVTAFTHAFSGEPAVRIEANEDFNVVLQHAFQKSFAESRPLLITGSFYLAAEAQRIYSAAGFQYRGS